MNVFSWSGASILLFRIAFCGRCINLHRQIIRRMESCGLMLHPFKTQIVYCNTESRNQDYPKICFDFLGFTFKPRRSKRWDGTMFLGFNPGVSRKALKKMNARIVALKVLRWSHMTIEEVGSSTYNRLRTSKRRAWEWLKEKAHENPRL